MQTELDYTSKNTAERPKHPRSALKLCKNTFQRLARSDDTNTWQHHIFNSFRAHDGSLRAVVGANICLLNIRCIKVGGHVFRFTRGSATGRGASGADAREKARVETELLGARRRRQNSCCACQLSWVLVLRTGSAIARLFGAASKSSKCIGPSHDSLMISPVRY